MQVSGQERVRLENSHSKDEMILNRVREQILASPQRSLIPAGPAAPSCIAHRHSRDSVMLLPNIAYLTVELLAITHEIGASLQDFACPENCVRTSNGLIPIFWEDVSQLDHHAADPQGYLILRVHPSS